MINSVGYSLSLPVIAEVRTYSWKLDFLLRSFCESHAQMNPQDAAKEKFTSSISSCRIDSNTWGNVWIALLISCIQWCLQSLSYFSSENLVPLIVFIIAHTRPDLLTAPASHHLSLFSLASYINTFFLCLFWNTNGKNEPCNILCYFLLDCERLQYR